jgi:hypothetical protein
MITATEIYIPPNCVTLKDITETQIRLGLQGYGGSGKTCAALSFPNPIVLNTDRGLGFHLGRSDVIDVPFHSVDFCKKLKNGYMPWMLKDVLTAWLEKEAPKLVKGQTLVIDGSTGLQNAYHRWFLMNQDKFLTKGGQVDGFAEWQQKKVWFGDLMDIFKSLNCDVVYLCHEVDQKDKNTVTGPVYSGKVRPLLTGAFGDELVSHFTDWFRQLNQDKNPDVEDSKLKYWGMPRSEYQKMLGTFPANSIYFWQTEGNDVFDAKRSSLVNAPRYIPATYESFCRYRRKVSGS